MLPAASIAADDGRAARGPGATPFAVALLLLLHLAPIWVFDYFPSQDGPAHVYNATVIREYGRPDRTAFREYYEIAVRPIPNLLGHIVLAGLLSAAPPRTAERLFLSIYVLLFVGSLFYALRARRPEPGFAWLLPFPLVYNYALHMGFYNFSLGVPISILAIGYVRADRDRFGFREAARLALLLLLLYFAHLLALILALVAIGVLAAWRIQRATTAADDGVAAAPGDVLRRHGLMPLLAAAPAAALAAVHLLRGRFAACLAAVGSLLALCAGTVAAARAADRGRVPARGWAHALLGSRALVPLAACVPAALVAATIHGGSPILGDVSPGPGLPRRLLEFWGIDALVSYVDAERALALATAALFAGAALLAGVAPARRGTTVARDGMGWVVLAFAALYFVAPNGVAGGGHILPRIGLYALLAAVLWLGGAHLPARLERAVAAGAATLAVLFLGLRAQVYAGFGRQLRDYAAAAAPIEQGATLLGLSYAPYGVAGDGAAASARVKPFMHAAGIAAAGKGAVLLNNYEAATGDFPVRYRAALDPAPYLGDVFYPRGRPVSLFAYPELTGGRIDYVLVWGLHGGAAPDPKTSATLAQLDAAYDLVGAPPASGHARLYRRRPDSPADAPPEPTPVSPRAIRPDARARPAPAPR